jgi:hypothetical protein
MNNSNNHLNINRLYNENKKNNLITITDGTINDPEKLFKLFIKMIGDIDAKHDNIMSKEIQNSTNVKKLSDYHTKGSSFEYKQFNAIIKFFKAFISKLISIGLLRKPTPHQHFFVIETSTPIGDLLNEYQQLINKYFDLIDNYHTNRYFIYFSYLLYFTFRTSGNLKSKYNKNTVESYFTIPNNIRENSKLFKDTYSFIKDKNSLLINLKYINKQIKQKKHDNLTDLTELIKKKIKFLKEFIKFYNLTKIINTNKLSQDELINFINMYIETIPSCKSSYQNYFSSSSEYKDCLKYKVYYWNILTEFLKEKSKTQNIQNIQNIQSSLSVAQKELEKHKKKFNSISNAKFNKTQLNKNKNLNIKVNKASTNNKNLNKLKNKAFSNHITK